MSEPGTFFKIALFLGIDFGYTRTLDKQSKILARCYHYFAILISIVALIIPITIDRYNYADTVLDDTNAMTKYTVLSETLWFLVMAFQFVTYTIVLLKSKYSLCDFLLDLESYDCNIKKAVKIGKIVWGFIIIMFASKGFFPLSSCLDTSHYFCDPCLLFRYTLYHIPSISIDIIVFELFMIYYYAYKYIKDLKCRLLNSETDLYIFRKQYIGLANSLDSIKTEYSMLLSLELIIDLPKLVGLLWATLVFMKEGAALVIYFGAYFYAFNVMVQVFIPSLMVSLVISQVNEVKIFLNEQLLREQEDNIEVLSVLRYMSARPLHHQLWQVFPTDLRLPTALFSLCVTYFIVLIQFSHLYD